MSDIREAAGGVNILILEGGGARGLSPLLIFNETMNRLQGALDLPQQPAVRECFDIVAGTGTGAVLACMIGRLSLPLEEAFKSYLKLAEVFSDKKLVGRPIYKTTKLHDVLKGIVKAATGNENTYMMDMSTDVDQCKTIVFAMSEHNMNAAIPRIFRSYKGITNQMPNCAIWQVLSASMAHPEMFKPISIGEGCLQESFVDGGFGCNNPTAHTLAEAKALFPGRRVSSIVCIGAGHPDTIRLPTRSSFMRLMPTDVLTVTKQIATDAERVAQEIAARFRSTKDVYFRFSVDQGMQSVGLSEWEKLSEVTAHTRGYMQRLETDEKMIQAVDAIKKRKGNLDIWQIDGEIQSAKVLQRTGVQTCSAPTPVFTGCQDKIDYIIDCISQGEKWRCVFVIYGLGGAGKTQLALKTVEQTKEMWTDVVFVDATSCETAETMLAQFAKERGVGDSHESAIRWLGGQNERWLMVIDNADDPSINVKQYFPTGNTGSIIITTRITCTTMLGRDAKSNCKLSSMEASEGLQLLSRTSRTTEMQGVQMQSEEGEAADYLLESFGYLALAIVQAGAYIQCSECTICQYRTMFDKNQQKTLERYRELPCKVDDYQHSVYTTWYMSYKLLSIGAQRLLHLMAFMHHASVVEDIFRCAATELPRYTPAIPESNTESQIRAYVEECLQPYLDSTGAWDSSAFLATMTELLSYSLVAYDRANSTYSIHVLVHDWASTVVGHLTNLAIDHTALLLALSIPHSDTTEDLAYILGVRLHVERLRVRQAEPSASNAVQFVRVYLRAGEWKESERLLQIVVEAHRRTLGETHSDTMEWIKWLAFSYQRQGRYSQALTLLEDILATGKQDSGDMHPSTLEVMYNLASTYYDMGQYSRAELLQVEVVDAKKMIWGPEHVETLNSMQELAQTYQALGQYEEAEKLLVKVVDLRTRESGSEHPDTLTAIHNVAQIYSDQGRHELAESLQLLVLEVRKRRIGGKHPNTLISMGNLASTYCKQRRYKEAEELEVQVIKIRQRVLGGKHPDALTAMNNLACTYYSQGRCDKAEELLRQVLDGRIAVLGARHPYVLITMKLLARLYEEKGPKRQQEYNVLRLKIEDLEMDGQYE